MNDEHTLERRTKPEESNPSFWREDYSFCSTHFATRSFARMPPFQVHSRVWSRVIILVDLALHFMKNLTRPPGLMMAAVACVAGAMLLLEVVVTRLFSVLFFYHFSFFAISLVMSGLVIGGILVSRWNVGGMSERSFSMRPCVAGRSLFSRSGCRACGIGSNHETLPRSKPVSDKGLACTRCYFFRVLWQQEVSSRWHLRVTHVGSEDLYAADLLAAAAACIAAIAALRTLQGTAVVALTTALAARLQCSSPHAMDALDWRCTSNGVAGSVGSR